MIVTVELNGKKITREIAPDLLLTDFVRNEGCLSVKRGCETANCGLCTVFLNDVPVLSCGVLTARADGCRVTTLEGIRDEAWEFGAFIADQGAEQCGFCNPGFVMNAVALSRRKRRSGNTWPETSAAVPAMRDSSAGYRRILPGKRQGGPAHRPGTWAES